MNNSDFKIGFWGCRGSMSAGGPEFVKYGANSCCVSMECGGLILVFDLGTGFVRFEDYYRNLSEPNGLHIFISHYHLDHVIGLPFADLVFDPSVPMSFYSRRLNNESPREILGNLFRPPYFPMPLMSDPVIERLRFNEISEVDSVTLPGGEITVDTLTVRHPHPGGSTCFRVNYNGKSVVYLSDYEYGNVLDSRLAELLRDADIVIFDAFFSDNNFREGWGHSTWQDGVYLSEQLGIRSFYMFHHHIKRTDRELDELQLLLSRKSDRCFVARESSFVYL